MKLEYTTLKDEDYFVLTDFGCHPSQELLKQEGLYKILWCKEKTTTIQVDGYAVKMTKDHVLFCTPLNNIRIDPENKDLIALVFNKEFFCIQTHDEQVSCNGFLFFGSAQPQMLKLRKKELDHFRTTMNFFEEDFGIQDHLQGEMLRSLLKRLLIFSTRLIKNDLPEPTTSNNQIDIIRQFNLFVEQHFREKHQVKEYADLLFKSPKTLSNLFKKYGDKTPLMMIHARILLEAKRLLLYSEKSTEEIAYDLGYKDAGHFSKFFKKNTGSSPSNFKKEKNSH